MVLQLICTIMNHENGDLVRINKLGLFLGVGIDHELY